MRRDGRLRNTNRFNAMENKEVVNRNSAESVPCGPSLRIGGFIQGTVNAKGLLVLSILSGTSRK